MDELAKKLIKIELKLNGDNNLPLGSLLADYWRQIYEKANGKEYVKSLPIKSSLVIIKINLDIIIGSLFKRFRRNLLLNKIIISKSSEKLHLNKLIDFISQNIDDSYVFDGNYKKFCANLGFYNTIEVLLRTLYLYVKNYKTISNVIKLNFKEYDKSWSIIFYRRLVCFLISLKFLEISHSKVVLADFDRGKFSPILLAANYLKIKTITLQHGAINPPYGYVPLIADEIWVWGQIWKNTLITMGVEESSIKIVGSSIVDDYQEPKSNMTAKIVGIGPNPIGVRRNAELWNSITSFLCDEGFKVVVKFHPSMNKEMYASCFHEACQIYEAEELENNFFFELVDLLIVSNSGLGYECVIRGTPVAVVRESAKSAGNDSLMIDKGNFIELNGSDRLLSDEIRDIENKYSSYIMEQQQFLKNSVFAFTGKDAQLEVLKRLKNVSEC